MPTRLTSVVIDSADPARLARWWADALGWEVTHESADECDVEPPAGEDGIELTFVPVADEKRVKNRVHLDLRSTSADDEAERVRRLLAAGATAVDIGQPDDASWTVLADPEGNEFCVLKPRPDHEGTGAVAAVVVDALEPRTLARFWAVASGWDLGSAGDKYWLTRPDGRGPIVYFDAVAEPHAVKNRWHLDVAPWADDDGATEVTRLLDLGATRAEVGQSQAPEGEVTWVVLADPEANEFCVLSARAQPDWR